MSLTFCYSFPAVMGKQAGRDYFVIMCPLKVLPKLFIFNDEDLSPEARSQRTLNKQRIPEISDYILSNRKDYVFSSLTASMDGQYEFVSFNNDMFNSIGTLKIDMNSRLLINDGQHRKSALDLAMKADPSLEDETISIVLFVDEGLTRSQQIFSDLNKHAVNVSKSISITFDHRDTMATLTKDVIYNHPYLYEYTDLEKSNLPKFSNKLFTISNFYKANQRIATGFNYDDPETKEKLDVFVPLFWDYLITHINEWHQVFNKEITPYTLREEYIISYGTILEAFGMIGNYLFVHNINNFDDAFKYLSSINWKRSNLSLWQNRVVGPNGRILRNTKCITLACNQIKNQLGLSLTEHETNLEKQFMEESNE